MLGTAGQACFLVVLQKRRHSYLKPRPYYLVFNVTSVCVCVCQFLLQNYCLTFPQFSSRLQYQTVITTHSLYTVLVAAKKDKAHSSHVATVYLIMKPKSHCYRIPQVHLVWTSTVRVVTFPIKVNDGRGHSIAVSIGHCQLVTIF